MTIGRTGWRNRGTAADALDARVSSRTPPMQDTVLIEALNHATSLELYQLAALIGG